MEITGKAAAIAVKQPKEITATRKLLEMIGDIQERVSVVADQVATLHYLVVGPQPEATGEAVGCTELPAGILPEAECRYHNIIAKLNEIRERVGEL